MEDVGQTWSIKDFLVQLTTSQESDDRARLGHENKNWETYTDGRRKMVGKQNTTVSSISVR